MPVNWVFAFAACGAVSGVGALVFTIRRDRRDTAERRKQLKVEGQKEGERLSDFVVRQTETVLHGWEGVNRELQERAEAVVVQLQAVTVERDQLRANNDQLRTNNEELRGRVNSLESEVASLKGEAAADRRTIQRMEREIAELRGAA